MAPTLTPFSYDDFLVAIATLSEQICGDVWRADLLVGIGRGGLTPAVYLSHATGIPMVSVDQSTPIAEFNQALIETLAARTRNGNRLLLVEDINDSGRTIAAIRSGMTANDADSTHYRIAVLLDNIVSAEQVDYRFRRIDRAVTKDWFVFPWEATAPRADLLRDAIQMPERLT